MESYGSPKKKATVTQSFNIFEDKENAGRSTVPPGLLKRSWSLMPLPLTDSKLANRLPTQAQGSLKRSAAPCNDGDAVDELLARLTHQVNISQEKDVSESSSAATDPYATTPPTESFGSNPDGRPDAAEVFRLKKELALAQERMAQMDLQLSRERQERYHQADIIDHQSQIARYTVEQVIGSPLPSHNVTIEAPLLRSGSGYRRGYTPPVTPGPFAVPASSQAPWVSAMPVQQQPSYVSTTEPLNYRRLLDRNTSANWRYIVDKIVCNNDQQASIFLQQKLKVGTADQKFEIVQAIIDQAYPLMVNRFGNFLVQRCFEHGTPEQVVAIAQAIRGNTLNLSMDAFGCHVVQKAFDCVPEEYKAIMVHELLRRIPETVIHRYACHVWQKLFELRWSDSPPQIMRYVNEALRGMWHEVALGETGSLVVQNIFENCIEEDKRPCISEVLASIDVVAHGQFGNWCIQHICEHGAIPDRTRAIDHVLRFATEYSMDQFASKVVEKCLKVGGNDFLDRYLDRVCASLPDRPRMPLIDIAGDQFGNYLIQYVLMQADPQRREIVATHIRKHMVSLRGSKYGSRVAMLCCNPAVSTRPGPGSVYPGRPTNRYGDFFGPDPGRTYVADRQFGGIDRTGGMGRNGFGGYR